MMQEAMYKNYGALVESLQPFYVFGFGSLIWKPEFDFEKKYHARVLGFHRRFGMWSVHYRGTQEQPGLVLGLDKGGSSVGVCFKVADNDRAIVAKNLWDREMIAYAYSPVAVTAIIREDEPIAPAPIFLRGDESANLSPAPPTPIVSNVSVAKFRPVRALAFALNPDNDQYVDLGFSLADKAKIIATAKGTGGTNRDYFLNMLHCLKKMNVKDSYLEALAREFNKLK